MPRARRGTTDYDEVELRQACRIGLGALALPDQNTKLFFFDLRTVLDSQSHSFFEGYDLCRWGRPASLTTGDTEAYQQYDENRAALIRKVMSHTCPLRFFPG